MSKRKKQGSVAGAPVHTPCTQCPLRSLATFRDFSAEELEFMLTFKSGELRLEKGNAIFLEGTNSPHLYTILSGWAFKYKSLEDGRRQVLNFALPGDFIGLQASIFESIGHSVEALTDMVLCVFPREKIWSLFEKHTSLSFDVTWLAAHEENVLSEHLVNVGQRSATERIAFVLLHLFERARQSGLVRGNTVQFPFTQEHLADTIGFSLVHTNKTLKHLRKTGSFRWTGPTFAILDADKLRALAGQPTLLRGARPLI